MSMINKEIDDFTVQAFHNDDFETVTKDDVLGKWSVFFFYPADFTFVCPTELEDLGALYDKFQEANCEIYAVSCDTHFAHKAWHDASENIKNLPYPMLADPTHKLADIFDVYIEEEGVAERGSFIVNPEGKIVCYEVNAGNIGRNASAPTRLPMVTACARSMRVAMWRWVTWASSWPSTATPCAPRAGCRAPRCSIRASTWWASCKPASAAHHCSSGTDRRPIPCGVGRFRAYVPTPRTACGFRLSAACARIPRAQAGTRWR